MALQIVHLATFYTPHVGGIEEHLLRLNQRLRELGHRVTVITQHHHPSLPLEEKLDHIQVIRLQVDQTHLEAEGFFQKTKHKIQIWLGLSKQLYRLLSADIIHIHDVFWWLIPFWPLLRMTKKCTVMTFHGYEGYHVPSIKQRLWHQLAARLTNANLCIGGFHHKYYGVTPSLISFGAVKMPSHRPQPRKQGKKSKLIYIGRLHPDTGIMTYLKALTYLDGDTYHLDVYGDGPQRAEAEALVKRYKLNVTFHGFMPHAAQYLAEADIAFVSRYLTILEAMVENVPVISVADNPIKFDYLQLTPFVNWITITDDPQEIAKVVKQRPVLSKTAFLWARQQTWVKLTDVYHHVWDAAGIRVH